MQLYSLLPIALNLESKFNEHVTYVSAFPKFQGYEPFSSIVIHVGKNIEEYRQLKLYFLCNAANRED